MVWCSTPQRAAELAALDNAAFSRALSAAFGDRLGRLSSQAPRHVFPLALSARRAQVQGRVAAIGNAAQTLHPVAGQGPEPGPARRRPAGAGAGRLAARPGRQPCPALAEFAGARQFDRLITAGLTDLMPRVFATGLAPVEHAAWRCWAWTWRRRYAPLARHLLGFRT